MIDLEINDLNSSDLDFDIREGMNLTLEQCVMISRLILREKLWARLISSQLEINFGYDFYMYMTTNFKIDELKVLVNKYNLFWEEEISPYFDIEDNWSPLLKLNAIYLKKFMILNITSMLTLECDEKLSVKEDQISYGLLFFIFGFIKY